ncbi:IclR family transcriptional regulator C-terminal domain-containing protein, partial [Burkholderia semiarida]
DQVRAQGHAFDNEEFLPGLLCLGVLVPSIQGGPSNMGLAVQAPIMRFPRERALSFLPQLRAAAEAIARINDEVPPGAPDDD